METTISRLNKPKYLFLKHLDSVFIMLLTMIEDDNHQVIQTVKVTDSLAICSYQPSLLVGPQDCIQCLQRADICKLSLAS